VKTKAHTRVSSPTGSRGYRYPERYIGEGVVSQPPPAIEPRLRLPVMSRRSAAEEEHGSEHR